MVPAGRGGRVATLRTLVLLCAGGEFGGRRRGKNDGPLRRSGWAYTYDRASGLQRDEPLVEVRQLQLQLHGKLSGRKRRADNLRSRTLGGAVERADANLAARGLPLLPHLQGFL
jgi:hypothetical protein